MSKKRRKCLLWNLGLAVVWVISVSGISLAAGGKSISADMMWKMAAEKAASIDPGSVLVKASYSRGNRDLEFEWGEFIFYTPNQKKNSNISIKIKNGEIVKVRGARYGNLDSKGIDPLPQKAVGVALENGFDAWWTKHPKAGLYVQLLPRKYFSAAPGNEGNWIWKMEGSGPGVPEDVTFFVNAETLAYLGRKVTPISKEYQNISEDKAKEQINKLLRDARQKK